MSKFHSSLYTFNGTVQHAQSGMEHLEHMKYSTFVVPDRSYLQEAVILR